MKWWCVTLGVIVGCRSAPPEIPPIALTPVEYNNTVRDLLGLPADATAWPEQPEIAARLIPSQGEQAGLFGSEAIALAPWPWEFPEEEGVNGFDGMVDGQAPSAYGVETMQKAAVHFASFALVSPTFFSCTDWEQADAETQDTCGWASVERFAQRAWRRPIEDEERTRLQAFWDSQIAAGTAEEAVVLTAAAILQSPGFLYRVETGVGAPDKEGVIRLTDWEMASRLSYFLWDSMPDEALFEAAYSGKLSRRNQVQEQARRMLADPRARDAVVRFHHQWLGTDEVLTVSPARRAFGPLFGITPAPALDTTDDGIWPAILGPLRHSMLAETHLFVERVVFEEEGTFRALMTDHHGYMSSHTEPLYGDGATAIAGGESVEWPYGTVVFSQGTRSTLQLYPAEFPPDQRAGVLTLPSVLALGAYPVHPAPVLRGKRILERLACQEFGAPPPEAEAAAPPDTTEVEATNRERTEEATSPTQCASCHDVINPPGFAFENYDGMGRWRAEDNGLAVDASGEFTLAGGETLTFGSGVELAQQLATNEQVLDCYALHWTRMATGVHLRTSDEAMLPIQEAFRQDDTIVELLVTIVGSDLFRFRRVGGVQ